MRLNKKKHADDLYNKAVAVLETGWFNWTPDYLAAETYFEEAGKLYKEIGEFIKSE
jgi:hypothetical protein